MGKSLLVANLALALAAGIDRLGFSIPTRRRVLICQFELPVPQFVSRLTHMRRALGAAADQHLLVDTRASGHLLSSAQGLNHFVSAAPAAAAEVLVLDPLYSTHDQDENDTRAMAALCQSLLRLRDTARAALVVVHHVRKSIGRHEIGSAFRGSSALHAVGDSYLLLTRPAPQLATIELRFQFRYAAAQPPRLLQLDPRSLWFSSTEKPPASATTRRKVEKADITQALADVGDATGLAPKESADYNPPAHHLDCAREGWASAPRCFQLSGATHPPACAKSKSSPFLWWSLGAAALGLKREDRPAVFAGRSESQSCWALLRSGYRSCLHKASILSHSPAPSTRRPG